MCRSVRRHGWYDWNTASEAYTILDNVASIIGKHTVKTGFLYRLEHSAYESGFPTGFNFTGDLTQDPLTGLGGNGLVQFMLGAVSDGGRGSSTGVMWTPYERFRYWGFFLQDDFRVTKNLTINFGVRCDMNGLYSVRTGNATNFCLKCVNPLTDLPGELVFEGTPQFPTGDIAPANKNSVAPRFNFSWAPGSNRKTVIRGGYDILYSNAFSMINSPGQAAANAPGWNQEFDWQGSFYPNKCAPRSGQCVAFPLGDESTDKNSLTTPPKSAGFPAARKDPLLGGFIQFFTPPSHDPMVQTRHLEVQRELPSHMMISVGFGSS